jgi:DNA primase
MAGRIPQAFIDDLLARTDIVELIDSHVPLKKSGRNYSACCPFHSEKTPSFSVSGQKQFFHCFGCGMNGNAITFLMEFERLEFVAAIEELANMHGLSVPRDGGDSKDLSRSRDQYHLLEQVAQFYRQQLKQNEDGNKAIVYMKQRGLTGDIARQFELGYAPDGFNTLLEKFKDKEQLLATGMLAENERGRVYDRFRQRLMFPIRDKRGRVIGFGGRVLGDEQPKYLNSPETDIFHKGRELYGLYQARKQHRHLAHVVIVEGYMDVVALAQYGVTNAVATLGTATSQEHIAQLARVTENLYFCFDGDRAGRAAAWKALETALPTLEGKHALYFCFLPDGHDPDSYIKAFGKDAFEQVLFNSPSLSTYLIDELKKQTDVATVDGRSRFIHLLQPLLAKIPKGIFRPLLVAEIVRVTGIDKSLVDPDTAVGERRPGPKRPQQKKAQQVTPVRLVIALLLQYPPLYHAVPEVAGLNTYAGPGAEILKHLLEILATHPHLNAGQLLEYWREHADRATIERLALWEHLVPEEGIEAEFRDAVRRLIKDGAKKEIEQLNAVAATRALTDDEKSRYRQLLVAQAE